MALRVCSRFFSSRLVSAEASSCFPSSGPAPRTCGRTGVFWWVPSSSISSEVFLSRLMKSEGLEADSGQRLPASVPLDSVEQTSLLMKVPDQPDKPRVLQVAVVGAPNAGKSTLSNQLLGRKVFAVSKKVHTTRTQTLGVLTEENTQIILLDTPGLTTPSKVKRHQLEKSLLVDPWNSVKTADLMVVMVDVADRWTCNRLDMEVLKCLSKHPDVPAVLVLNKVDLLKSKDRLLDITADLTCGVVNGRHIRVRPVMKPPWAEKRPDPDPVSPDGATEAKGGADPGSGLSKEQLEELRTRRGWSNFKDVFMMSAMDKEDVDTLKAYFVAAAKPGPWRFHSRVLTDQTPQDICTSLVREKLLENLPQEVPYSVTQLVDLWREGADGQVEVCVKVYVKKESHMRMVIGAAGRTVAQMAQEAGADLSRIFMTPVKLKLSVKLKK
ncbi:GTPase Era, mitochondrial-like [Sphaeramia orbicularis]|uniref:GTPase Era, mitochondrial n=1 Tax=Sphaeramia orbicularis TaxID=375764 RepID=A0A672YTE7_9TELE|nr:GTPase Era, mitochondrial-like [Sphaeramia orbicularis]